MLRAQQYPVNRQEGELCGSELCLRELARAHTHGKCSRGVCLGQPAQGSFPPWRDHSVLAFLYWVFTYRHSPLSAKHLPHGSAHRWCIFATPRLESASVDNVEASGDVPVPDHAFCLDPHLLQLTEHSLSGPVCVCLTHKGHLPTQHRKYLHSIGMTS